MKKEILSLSLLIASAIIALPAQAATDSITKSAPAKVLFIYSTGQGMTGLNGMFVSSGDFPSGTWNLPKTLTQVQYSVAGYPQAYTETVELCYFKPYQGSPTRCITVPSGSSGTTTQFNDLTFAVGVELQIRHVVTGNPGDNIHPSRTESVTWDYSY